MLLVSPDGCNCPFRTKHRRDMCSTKLRISSFTTTIGSNQLSSFAQRAIATAVSILGVTMFLLWLRYQTLVLQHETIETVPGNWSSRKNTGDNSLEIRRSFDNSVMERIASTCQTHDCTSIDCWSISNDRDPGTVASNFIESEFRLSCKNAKSVKLSFNDCKFPENKLRRGWLRTNLSIEELTFSKCFIDEMEDGVFSASIYQRAKRIVMAGNKLRVLRRATFRGLEELNELTIRENVVEQADFDLLADTADTLTILELYGAIHDRETLRNITGGSVPLSKLLILSLRGNSVPVIDRELFVGVPSVQSLYLDGSKVNTVARDTLAPMAFSLLQLILNDNDIATLPQGFLDTVIDSRQPFRMTAQNNPWHCDCSLKWMQDLVRSESSVVVGTPFCKTPEINAGKSFLDADFCYQSNTTSSAGPIVTGTRSTDTTKHDWTAATTHSTEPVDENVNLTCNFVDTFLERGSSARQLPSKEILQLRSRYPNFFVSSNVDRDILVKLPDLSVDVTLLWFSNDDVLGSLRCAKNVKHSYLLQNIDPETSYTICLLADNENTVSPLNCLAVTTNPAYEHRVWLMNKDRATVYGVSVFALILLFFLGILVAFLTIRTYPSLLRGNRRVMLVKHRHVDAIILPKGVYIDEAKSSVADVARDDRKLHEDGYVTPLPPTPIPFPRRSRVSRVSLQSDVHSYVSQIDPPDTEPISWRLTRLYSEIEKRKSYAPPLPLHRENDIPSLSSSVDSREESEGYYTSSVYRSVT